jgi:protein subunit release factor A
MIEPIDPTELQVSVYSTAVSPNLPSYRCCVRIVHMPTGLTASCDDTNSVLVNQARAMAKLAELMKGYVSQ